MIKVLSYQSDEWWDTFTKNQQEEYLKLHPKSKRKVNQTGNPGSNPSSIKVLNEDKKIEPPASKDAGTYYVDGKPFQIPSREDPTKTLSPDATGWLYAYQWGIEGTDSNKVRNPTPSDDVLRELIKYVGKEPNKCYRAQLKKYDPQGRWLESWSRYLDDVDAILEADSPEGGGKSEYKLVSQILNPDEIIIDTTRLPKKFRDAHDAGTQNEVIRAIGPLAERLKKLRLEMKARK